MSLNVAILKGNLCKENELKYTQGENPIAVLKNTIAVKRQGKKDESDFINIIAFGKVAEFINNYFTKGQEILVNGRIQTGKYQDKEGKNVYTTDVVVENVEFCGKKKEENNVQTNNTKEESIDDCLPF